METKTRPKILFAVTQSEFGGAQRFLYNLNTHIQGEYETTVVVGADGGGMFVEALRSANIPCVVLQHLRRALRPWSDLLGVFEFARTIRRVSPQIVFLTSSKAGVLGTLATMLARRSGVKCTLIYRIDWAFNDPRSAWERKMYVLVERFLSKFRDIIIQNDRYDLSTARANNIKPRLGFKVIHNGVDVENFSFLDREAARTFFQDRLKVDLNAFDLVIGNTANFYKTKGLSYLLQAIKSVSQTANVACVVVGDGPERVVLEEQIRAGGLEGRVFLPGQIPQASRYLKAFDLFAFSSVKEGFPWAILEAMAAELPIVATKVGALPEVIEDGKSGWLVDPKNAEQLADRLSWFIAHRDQLPIFAHEARKRVETQFTLDRLLKNYRSLFEMIVSGREIEIPFD